MLSRMILSLSMLLVAVLGFVSGIYWRGQPETVIPEFESNAVLEVDSNNTVKDNHSDIESIKLILAGLPKNQRKNLLHDPQAFSDLVQNESDRKTILRAITDNALQISPELEFIQQRAQEKVITDAYIRQILLVNFPKNYPTDDDLKAYYDVNIAHFRTSERVGISQIFRELPSISNEKSRKSLIDRFDLLVRQIKQNDMSFSDAVRQFSTHPSRYNGGDLGLVELNKLLPEIRKNIDLLTDGEVSQPIQTEHGIHIVKRLASAPAIQLEFPQVANKIRKILTQQALNETKSAIMRKLRETYPIKLDDQTIEKWRQDLIIINPATSDQ